MATFIDLFAGAGGLSEGFVRAGFEPIAHVEMMPDACKTLLTRGFYYDLIKTQSGWDFYNSYLTGVITQEQFYASLPEAIKESVICKKMSHESLPEIFKTIDKRCRNMRVKKVDVIIGGPPCQAYSLVGRARKNMGEDPRNWLYLLYIEFLKKYKPKIFVFENVQGIKTAGGGSFIEDIRRLVDEIGYKMDIRLLKAQEYGVLQNRKREIIIGLRKDDQVSPIDFPYPKPLFQTHSEYEVADLLSDLPSLKPGESNNSYNGPATRYLTRFGIRKENDILTWHLTRPIREFDRNIYRFVIDFYEENGRCPKYTEIPAKLRTHRNQKAFLDRFKIVPAHAHYAQTMVAHISKDGHYYIHPDKRQARSLSVREAARIQSFPDDFYFEGSRTSVLTQIGNAVPPLLAYQIALEIKKHLKKRNQAK